MERDSLPVGGIGEGVSDEIFEFVVEFDCVEVGIGVKAFGYAECRIAGESAEFEHPLGADHSCKHLEETPLEVAGAHSAIYEVDIGGTFEAVEVIGMWVDMPFDVVE